MGKKTGKRTGAAQGQGQGQEAVQVFRQFAWNIAGTLKKARTKTASGANGKKDARA